MKARLWSSAAHTGGCLSWSKKRQFLQLKHWYLQQQLTQKQQQKQKHQSCSSPAHRRYHPSSCLPSLRLLLLSHSHLARISQSRAASLAGKQSCAPREAQSLRFRRPRGLLPISRGLAGPPWRRGRWPAEGEAWLQADVACWSGQTSEPAISPRTEVNRLITIEENAQNQQSTHFQLGGRELVECTRASRRRSSECRACTTRAC